MAAAQLTFSPTISPRSAPEWKNTVGKGTSVKWPVGIGGKGNEGVAGIDPPVARLHWVYRADLRAAEQDSLWQSCRIRPGNFIKASLQSTTAAASGVKMPADFRVSITNPPGKDAYPDCQLHLAADSHQSGGREQGQDPEGFSLLDAGQGPDHDGGAVLCPAAQRSGGKGEGGD